MHDWLPLFFLCRLLATLPEMKLVMIIVVAAVVIPGLHIADNVIVVVVFCSTWLCAAFPRQSSTAWVTRRFFFALARQKVYGFGEKTTTLHFRRYQLTADMSFNDLWPTVRYNYSFGFSQQLCMCGYGKTRVLIIIFYPNVNTLPSGLCCRNSVCRLSVTLVHPTQGVEAFGNISSALCTLATL